MTDATVSALIGAIPTTIAALAAAFIGIRNGIKTAAVNDKVVEIHQQTNGNLTAVKDALVTANGSLAVAHAKIEGLQSLVKANDANNAERVRGPV